ncbi:MAG: BlaI/MecI/CopY family transcriptional regulator [Pirellulaceae bacterium]|jgi:predicted transcriptional regulator|nr:BlaI/MecI/CopY family transcriptional regulator [Pirellulaceae bacterium]
MAKRKHQLAELQLAIMQVLWRESEATVGAVREALEPERSLAYTTVGTMLSKMESKGVVRCRNDGRVNLYRPAVDRDQVSQTMVTDLAERLFAGDVTEMVCQLLDASDISGADLAELRKLIRRKERELRDG